MMDDLLDRVLPVAGALLDRVDSVLAGNGAPAGDPVWSLLRRLGALPGELVRQFATADPEALAGAGDLLRTQSRDYERGIDSVPMPASWRGAAAEAYLARFNALAGHQLALAAKRGDTASYLDDVAAWLRRSRRLLAGVVGESLGSAEALTLVAAGSAAAGWSSGVGGGGFALGGSALGGSALGSSAMGAGGSSADVVARAAALIGAHVLSAAAEVLDDGELLERRWAGQLDEVEWRTPASGIDVAAAAGLDVD
jgi:hypothetical protein